MKSLMAAVTAFARDEDGVTAIEYGLIAATMVAAVALAFSSLTPALTGAFASIAAKIVVP